MRSKSLPRLLVLRCRVQNGHRTALQRIPRLALERQWLWGGIEHSLPALPLLEGREWNDFVMGVHQQEKGVAHHQVTRSSVPPMRSPARRTPRQRT